MIAILFVILVSQPFDMLTATPSGAAVDQAPMPAAAIKAARDARADVETAQRKNSDALNPPAGQPQTQAHPAAPAAPAGTGAVTQAPAAPGPPAPDGVYTYDAQGRRDPFVNLLNRGDALRPAGAPRPGGLQGLLINEIIVKGILKTRDGLVAVVQGSDNRTYIVHAGERVLDGSIKSIAQDAIVFAQDVNDPLSTVKQREVRKTIRTDAR
jgi:Tfp pilus assembly protein PilP